MNGDFRKAFLVVLGIVVLFSAIRSFPEDDALRHVGLAFGNFSNWGHVYPFSSFEDFDGYDPWYGYDASLRMLARLLQRMPWSNLTIEFLLVKILILAFATAFLVLVVKRSRILDEIRDGPSFCLGIALFWLFCIFAYNRSIMLRPFLFGSLYLFYSIGKRGILRGILSSLLLAFFYPYLCWFYILPVAFAHVLKGSRRFAVGAVSSLVVFIVLQPSEYWHIIVTLFASGSGRSGIVYKIGELVPSYEMSIFYIFLGVFLILFPFFSSRARSFTTTTILLLLCLVPGIKHNRYFGDMVLPLVFLAFGPEMCRVLDTPFRMMLERWRILFQGAASAMAKYVPWGKGEKKRVERPRRSTQVRGSKVRIAVLILAYLVILVIFMQSSLGQLRDFEAYQKTLADIPQGSMVLSAFNLQYRTLFVRPDLRIIPSCEMGFADPRIRAEYEDYFNKGLIKPLADKTDVGYFIECPGQIIDPREGNSLTLLREGDQVRTWRIDTQDSSANQDSGKTH